MYKRFYLVGLCFMLSLCLISQVSSQNNAFKVGEKLSYKVFYSSSFGELSAGEAVVDVKETTFENQAVFHFVGQGETKGILDVFYKVRDRFESKANKETLHPYTFLRKTREGNFSFDDTVFFDKEKDTAISSRKKLAIPDDVHNLLTGVYFMRTLSVNDFGEDSVYYLNFYLDDSVYSSVIKYEGKGVIETKWGWLPCLKVKPMLVTGKVFTNQYPMSFWITDDENHVPVLGESEIIVGSIKMELSKYEGLKNPFIEPLSIKELRNFK